MVSMTASAILADIQVHFAGVDEAIIQMVLTIPALLAVFFAFASGPLSMRIPKKSLVIFGLFSGLTGGMIALIFGSMSIGVLLCSSVLIGIAQGINSTMTMALIADLFVGDESGAMMGLQSAVVNGGSMVLVFTSGFLAGIQWNYSYLVYLAFIPVIMISIRNLPRDAPPAHEEDHTDKSGKLNATVFFTALVMFLYRTFLFVYQTNIALLVVSSGYGDASTSGLINTSMSAAGMVTGILFGRFQRVLKHFTIPVALLISGIGMLLIFSVGTLNILFIAAICMGFGMATIMPAGTLMAASAVNAGMRATAIAITTAAVSLGMFMSPIIMNALSNSVADGSIAFKFMLSAIGFFSIALMTVAGNKIIVKKQLQSKNMVS